MFSSEDFSEERPLRIGTVSYLNAVPLHAGLEGLSNVRLTRDVPSALADALVAGELDVGLIPAVEVFRHEGYQIVPNAAIACRGAVWTVKLFSRKLIADVREVALDTSSRTSAALVRILLEDFYGISPRYRPTPPVADVGSVDADATLLIGDPVFQQDDAAYYTVDLGEAWYRWTQLPFVFAVWAVRPGIETKGISTLLNKAKQDGLRNLRALAQREAASRKLDPAVCYTYLMEYVRYDLSGDALAGLARFLELAHRHKLIPRYMAPQDLLLGSQGGFFLSPPRGAESDGSPQH